eukprot:UN01828
MAFCTKQQTSCILLLLTPFFCNTESSSVRTRSVFRENRIRDVSFRINSFSFDLYDEATRDTRGNVLYSPYSIYLAFTMLGMGSNGTTKQQLVHALKYD